MGRDSGRDHACAERAATLEHGAARKGNFHSTKWTRVSSGSEASAGGRAGSAIRIRKSFIAGPTSLRRPGRLAPDHLLRHVDLPPLPAVDSGHLFLGNESRV